MPFYETTWTSTRFNTPIERVKVEFRSELYNIFNQPTFTCPAFGRRHGLWYDNNNLRAYQHWWRQMTGTLSAHRSVRLEDHLLSVRNLCASTQVAGTL